MRMTPMARKVLTAIADYNDRTGGYARKLLVTRTMYPGGINNGMNIGGYIGKLEAEGWVEWLWAHGLVKITDKGRAALKDAEQGKKTTPRGSRS